MCEVESEVASVQTVVENGELGCSSVCEGKFYLGFDCEGGPQLRLTVL